MRTTIVGRQKPAGLVRVSLAIAVLRAASCTAAAPVSISGGVPHTLVPSQEFAVSVDGEQTFVYQATVDGVSVHNGSFVHVPLRPGQEREVVITVLMKGAQPQKTAALRPDPVGKEGSLPDVERVDSEGRQWKFTTGKPLRCVLEFGDAYQLTSFSSGLMVFADWEDTSAPDSADRSVLFFGPGVHFLDEQPTWGLDIGTRGLQLQSHTTLYLAEGAVLLGLIRAFNVQNVSIRGRGIISATFLPGAVPPDDSMSWSCNRGSDKVIEIVNGSDVHIEGVTVMHSTAWNIKLMSLKRVHIHGVKVLSWKCWGDGIDVVSSQDVLIEDVFIRSDDDSIAVKGMDPSMSTKDVVVRDAVLWNQMYGNCMEVGFELFNAEIKNVTFERIVCLHQTGSIMSIHNGGSAAVHGIYYSDIVVQTLFYEQVGTLACRGNGCLMLFDFSIVFGQYCRLGPPPKGTGCTDPDLRGLIANVSLSSVDVHSNGVPWVFSQLMGNSTTHDVNGVSIKRFTMDGVLAESLADLNATRNDYVRRIKFSPPAVTVEPILT